MDSVGSKNYDYLIDVFGEDKIEKRYQLLLSKSTELVYSFCRSLDERLKKYFHVNELLIQDIVINYFADIDRLKKFHDLKKVNSIKIAAYTAYWYAKIRPVQIISDINDDHLEKYRRLFTKINEKVSLGMCLGIAFDNSVQSKASSKTTELYRAIVYSMAYRTNTPQTLELMIHAHTCDPSSPPQNMED